MQFSWSFPAMQFSRKFSAMISSRSLRHCSFRQSLLRHNQFIWSGSLHAGIHFIHEGGMRLPQKRCKIVTIPTHQHCIVLNSFTLVLYYSEQNCIELFFTELHCTYLYYTALHCTELTRCTVLHCTALH